MKLPNFEQAEIAEAKILVYLLNEAHQSNKGKAAFFLGFGFTLAAWHALADAFRQQAAENDITTTLATEHGIKYVIEGTIKTPDGRTPNIRTVWVVETNSNIPKLVTAYRLRKK